MNDYYDEETPTKRPEDGELKPGEGMPLRGGDLEVAPATKPENDAENELRRRAPLHYRPADFDDAPTIPCDRSDGTFLAGRYHVLRKLGGGGMGDVYLAEDTQLDNKLFAIKMLPSVLASDKRAYRQLKEEALTAMKLTHSNIVTLRAFEENGGNPFLVMDYIEGKTLSNCLADKGKLSAGETASLLKPVAAALDYAHSQKVVHRDIKPGNVLIRKDGVPFVLDFGIAREIHETMTRVTGRSSGGTLLYMSPEQLNGASPKPAQDVYSFAAMAYECMKGDPPFVRGDIEHQIENKTPEPLPSGTPIAAGVTAGLAKKPEGRPASCMAVIEGRVPAAHNVRAKVAFKRRPTAQQPLVGEIYVKPAKTKTGLLLAGAAALAVAVLGGWWFGRSGKSGERLRSHSATNATVVISENACPAPIPSPAPAPAKPAPAPTLQQGETRTLTLPGGATMKMIYVAPGSFMMGSPGSEEDRGRDETQHHVTLTKGFWLGKYEVTQAQWKSVMGSNPSEFKGDNLPVENVSWNDCQEFIRKVNTEAERQFGGEARLPTEAEWEYACRAGSAGAFAGTGDLDSMGWYWDNSGDETHPVGQKRPNAWGFYDMHGNVYEWCSDWFGSYPGGSVTDPAGAASGVRRVLRGGSWNGHARHCRSAIRNRHYPGFRGDRGFRLACSAGQRGHGAGETSKAENASLADKAEPVSATQSGVLRQGETKTLTLPVGATMEMIYVAPGSFTMGSPESETGHNKDETQHRVTLTKGFWLGKYEVTQAQWESVMGDNPSEFKGDNLPVENVSWNDCQEFIRKVNAEAERQFGGKARLPTEAEWEYACRAGSTGAFAGTGDLDSMGWYWDNSGHQTHPVGQKRPNAWGFYDMHGNVYEWCNDWYGAYPGGSVTDPAGAASGDRRVLRGGGWNFNARDCRSAHRIWNFPGLRFRNLGFRLARSAGPRGQGAEQ